MVNISAAFENPELHKVLYDMRQFQTVLLSSTRGGGKSFAVEKVEADNFYKRGEFFVLLRETQAELDEVLSGGFWDEDLITRPEYAEHSYTIRGNRIMIDDTIVGVGFALTTYSRLRFSGVKLGKEKKVKKTDAQLEEELAEAERVIENSKDKLTSIFFDEFEPLKPYMKGAERWRAFLHICETLFRFRQNVRVYMCANLSNAHSPFLSGFHFPDADQATYGIHKSYTIVDGKYKPLAVWLHMKTSDAWKKLRAHSYVGKIVGTDSDMFATGAAEKAGKYKRISEPKKRSIIYNLDTGDGTSLTYWYVASGGFQVTQRTKNTSFPTYTFDLKSKTPGVKIIPKNLQDFLLDAYARDRIEFENAEVFERFIKILPNRRVV